MIHLAPIRKGNYMNVNEAKEALINTVDSILAPLTERGLTVDSRYFFSDRDLIEISEDYTPTAAILACETRVCDPETHEELAFEAAVAIDGGEILNDEIAREAATLRESVRELLAALDEHETVKDAFEAIIPKNDDERETAPAPSNLFYYVGGGIIVVLIILAALLFGR